MQTKVSEAYLLGISEGRAQLKWHLANGFTFADYREGEIDNLRTLLSQNPDDTMRDLYRGSLDFALNQKVV